ncbi:MAG: hypothetical protein AAFP86_23030 [Planctomycetota bacterium]
MLRTILLAAACTLASNTAASERGEPGGNSVGERYCVAALNASGRSASIEARGSRRVDLGDLTLVARDMPVGSFGIFMAARAQGYVPGAGLGTLCLGGEIGYFRLAPQIRRVDRTGAFELELDLEALPLGPILQPAQPGQTWYFQAWFRDGLPGLGGLASHNFSDGVSVRFS